MRARIAIAIAIVFAGGILIFATRDNVKAQDNYFVFPNLQPGEVILSPDSSKLYVSCREGVAKISIASMELLNVYSTPGLIYNVTLDGNGEYIYCVSNSGDTNNVANLTRINTYNGNTLNINLSPSKVYSVAIDEAGEYLYVSGGTWPPFEELYKPTAYHLHYGTGRIFEVRLSDFTLVRTAELAVALQTGLCCQGGKLVVFSPEAKVRPAVGLNDTTLGSACHVIDVETLTIERTFGVPGGEKNTSLPLPGATYVMMGFNSDIIDGAGYGLLNVITGEVEHWYITDPNPHYPDWNEEGGGYMMTLDETNNILYSTLFVINPIDQPYYRMGKIDLNTNTYSDWYIEPFRIYGDIVFDPSRDKLYLTAPFDDAIVVLEPPGYNNPPVADFSFNPTQGPAPLTVTFENHSYDEDGEIVRIECDWDGDQQVDEWKTGNPSSFEHTFANPGYINFILTVVDDDEQTASWVGLVYVE